MIARLSEGFHERFGFAPTLPKNLVELHSKVFEVSDKLHSFRFKMPPLSEGLLLATLKNKIIPSHYLLELNKDKFRNTIILDEKISFLFTCGRKLLKSSISEKKGSGPIYIVMNKRREVLGLCEYRQGEYTNLVSLCEYFRENKLLSVEF